MKTRDMMDLVDDIMKFKLFTDGNNIEFDNVNDDVDGEGFGLE